ncbi:hypothetical protein ACLB2K_046774 [Fragaria x ananassa]
MVSEGEKHSSLFVNAFHTPWKFLTRTMITGKTLRFNPREKEAGEKQSAWKWKVETRDKDKPKHELDGSSSTSNFPLPPTSKPSFTVSSHFLKNPQSTLHNLTPRPIIVPALLSFALSVTLTSPLPVLAIPSLNSQTNLAPPTTPFSQSKTLQVGLENGKIRPCPSINPGCISTNPRSSSFAFPLTIPEKSTDNAIQKLQEAILETQKNPNIKILKDTPDGQYLQAEVDGGFGRDVLEFLVKGDLVSYRCMATKVFYLYPFTTALGNSNGQEERLKKITDQLGWYAPSFEAEAIDENEAMDMSQN